MAVNTRGDLTNILLAHGDPGITEVMNTWWHTFGSEFNILHLFQLAGYWTRFGAWGATRLVADRDGPKFKALQEFE